MQLQKQWNDFFYEDFLEKQRYSRLVKISADPELFSPFIQDKSAEFHRSFESFKQTIRDGNP